MALLFGFILWLATGASHAQFTLENEGSVTVRAPGYRVGEAREPAHDEYLILDGEEILLLRHLLYPQQALEAPVRELKLVQPYARQTILGVRVGNTAYQTARRVPRNSLFYRNPRVACAAFVSAMFKRHGVRGYSFAVNTFYTQVRAKKNRSGRGGGRLVASRVSTRYTPYFPFFKAGDLLFFHKGGRRLGHMEIYVGRGLTAGTSSSEGRVAVRRVGNRGYRLMSVVRV